MQTLKHLFPGQMISIVLPVCLSGWCGQGGAGGSSRLLFGLRLAEDGRLRERSSAVQTGRPGGEGQRVPSGTFTKHRLQCQLNSLVLHSIIALFVSSNTLSLFISLYSHLAIVIQCFNSPSRALRAASLLKQSNLNLNRGYNCNLGRLYL